jgi:membrane-anchored protein YejM (alkaline phosphatase superfamily)
VSGYRWLWVGWGAAFLVLEFVAILRRRYQDTLSEFVWHLCQITPGRTSWSWTATHLFVALFLVWLLLHLAFGYFR